jgi:hypothetical protein
MLSKCDSFLLLTKNPKARGARSGKRSDWGKAGKGEAGRDGRAAAQAVAAMELQLASEHDRAREIVSLIRLNYLHDIVVLFECL